MKKGKVMGLTTFTYDVKNRQTGLKTGEQNTLGKVFIQFTEEGTEGLVCQECLVNMTDYAIYKIGQDVLIGKINNKYGIAK